MSTERVTIRHVAHSAGVSVATVSRVFAQSSSVSEELTARVLDAARRLGYTPHAVAQSLASGRTRVVGVLVPNLANPYFYALIKNMLHEADRDGYRLIVADSDESLAAEPALGMSLLGRSDGLIMLSPRCGSEVLKELGLQGKPIMVVNRQIDELGLSSVLLDNFTPMRQLAMHTVELGHRHLVYLQGPVRSWQEKERWRAMRSLRVPGVTVTPIRAGGTMENGRASAERVLATGCTAVLAHNDLTAIGLIAGLNEHGVSVPGDISVTGFDDIPFARFTSPALTTVHSPQEDIGRATWRMTAGLLHGDRPGARTMLTTQPVIRASTAPPK
ncbi:LacI family DNA-binding transcriptional regulator [Planotetraspora sp. GP83]|uniref:LacI family DNA-binding transcriptional regulator n=1 Tax=Planotetraspora sp. GP83 TaxID=3156264 RepID=UPI003514E7E0